MPQQSKTIRLFVSSTFSDLKAERDALQGEVFPRLKQFLPVQGLAFHAIDLRGTIETVTKVFLSYARGDDEPFVRRLHADLVRAGLEVWFDCGYHRRDEELADAKRALLGL